MSRSQPGAPHALYRRYVAMAVAATATMMVMVPVAIVLSGQSAEWWAVGAGLTVAGTVGLVCAVLTWTGLLRRHAGQVVLYLWSLADIGVIGTTVAATGGPHSWFWVLFPLTVIFFSVGYPMVGQVALFGATVAAFLAACDASGVPVDAVRLLWQITVLVATFALASFPAWELRRQTAEHSEAREEASRLATALGEQERWWRSLIERTSDPIVVFDDAWRVIFASPAFERLLQYRPQQYATIDVAELVHREDAEAVQAAADRAVDDDGHADVLCRLRRADGTWRTVEVAFTVLPPSRVGRVVANLHDVTERAAAEAALTHQAMHDPLTGLANRIAFYESLHTCLAVASRTGSPLSVLVLDLEGFKEVNDSWGHATGDELLVTVSHRMTDTLRGADVTARLGGDEFAAVLVAGGDEQGAVIAAGRVLAAIGEPVVLSGRAYWLRASIGIACFPDHARTAEELVQRADRAMYEAKRTGAGVAVYEPSMDASAVHRGEVLNELRQAVREDQLVLFYQPKMELATGRIAGVEALVRWLHPERGLLGPGAFLPVAESSGLIREITAWVLPTAVRQVAEWSAAGLELSVAVNLSAQDLVDEALVPQVAAWLERARVPPSKLTLELTEASALADRQSGTGSLERLRRIGVRVSLDDFGSGYSSLSYLAELPLDEMKLDGAFLRTGLGEGGFVLRSVVDIGHHLGLVVVAEGVETPDELRQVAATGVDVVQGYIYSQPVPADELVATLYRAGWARSLRRS
ncbi:MAG: putative bifunctional diguanylate cyclase/phosphodiesterase [Acidimicrobiales bacterium]